MSYPKKIVLQGDTCIVITSSQLIAINYKLQYKNYLIKQNNNLHKKVEIYQLSDVKKDSLILRQQLLLKNYDENIVFQLAEMKVLANDNASLRAKVEKQKKVTKFLVIGGAVLAFVTGLLVP